MPLLVKVMAPEGTLVVVSRVITLTIQTLESVRARCTTIVNPKIPKYSNKNPTLPPGLQDSSQHVGESLDSLNLLSRTSSRAGK